MKQITFAKLYGAISILQEPENAAFHVDVWGEE